jgi:hypothetical protein
MKDDMRMSETIAIRNMRQQKIMLFARPEDDDVASNISWLKDAVMRNRIYLEAVKSISDRLH